MVDSALICVWLLGCDRRLAARRKLPYAQRLLVEDDEARLRKALASEAKKGDPAGKIARGLARLQVHAAVADPGLLAAAKKCVVTAARREELAAEAARLEKKGQLREALQQCVISWRCRCIHRTRTAVFASMQRYSPVYLVQVPASS
jgi:hypothetical protein